MPNLEDLEARIANGESYLKINPDDENAQVLYWRLVQEHVALAKIQEIRQDINVVTLELPPNCQWAKDEDSPKHSVVKVLMHAQPKTDDEMRIKDLAALNESLSLRQEPGWWQRQ